MEKSLRDTRKPLIFVECAKIDYFLSKNCMRKLEINNNTVTIKFIHHEFLKLAHSLPINHFSPSIKICSILISNVKVRIFHFPQTISLKQYPARTIC